MAFHGFKKFGQFGAVSGWPDAWWTVAGDINFWGISSGEQLLGGVCFGGYLDVPGS